MMEIKTGQTLELYNVLSFRGKLTQGEVQQIGKDINNAEIDVYVGINPNIL